MTTRSRKPAPARRRLSIRATAAALGIDERGVRKAITRGVVSEPGPDRLLDVEVVRQELAAGVDPSRRNGGHASGDHAREILLQRARLLRLQADERDGLLVSRKAVDEMAFSLGRRVRDRLLQAPDRLAAEFDWEPAVTLRVEEVLREALEELSQEVEAQTKGGSS